MQRKNEKNKNKDLLFRQIVTDSLQKQHMAGLTQGAYAMCQVVLDKAKDDSKTADERIADIIRFCSTCIGADKLAGKEQQNA